jgi:hypothetical protein
VRQAIRMPMSGSRSSMPMFRNIWNSEVQLRTALCRKVFRALERAPVMGPLPTLASLMGA